MPEFSRPKFATYLEGQPSTLLASAAPPSFPPPSQPAPSLAAAQPAAAQAPTANTPSAAVLATSVDPRLAALPASLTDSTLFHGWETLSFKLYVWLRAHGSRGPGEPLGTDASATSLIHGYVEHGYIEVDVTGSEIERVVGISKNTVTKLARDLQEVGVVTFRGDRVGYHFRLGEWLSQRAAGANLDLQVESYYLEALIARKL